MFPKRQRYLHRCQEEFRCNCTIWYPKVCECHTRWPWHCGDPEHCCDSPVPRPHCNPNNCAYQFLVQVWEPVTSVNWWAETCSQTSFPTQQMPQPGLKVLAGTAAMCCSSCLMLPGEPYPVAHEHLRLKWGVFSQQEMFLLDPLAGYTASVFQY